MERKVLWPVLVIGLALVVVPFAIGLPGKAAAGQRMLNDFRPLMGAAHVQKTAAYYNDVFVPLGTVANQFTAASANPQMQARLKPLLPMLQPVLPIFKQVPAGLAWYKPLVSTMQGNVSDYSSVTISRTSTCSCGSSSCPARSSCCWPAGAFGTSMS